MPAGIALVCSPWSKASDESWEDLLRHLTRVWHHVVVDHRDDDVLRARRLELAEPLDAALGWADDRELTSQPFAQAISVNQFGVVIEARAQRFVEMEIAP